jgi:hypothetical protein
MSIHRPTGPPQFLSFLASKLRMNKLALEVLKFQVSIGKKIKEENIEF